MYEPCRGLGCTVPNLFISEGKLKKKEKEIQRNIERFEQEIKERKKIPAEEKKKIHKRVFINISILIVILSYLLALKIGESNIQTDTYMIMLKVLSVICILITITLFEISYKFNKNEIILHSIEMLFLTFLTLFLIPAYALYYGSFYKVIYAAMIGVSIYYVGKALIIRRKMKKKYYKSLSDIKTIVAKR